MNKVSFRLYSIIMAGILLASPLQRVYAQEVVASYQTFYDQMSPYGQWVSDAQYGDVWVPNAAPGYRPYATNGHWAMTDYGNMWVSDEPYGWAVYHYGRWTYNPYYGWVWIPGHEWAPAWVSWRSGGGYYGWAPMGPGYEAGGSYAYPDNYWVFVSPGYLYNPNVYNYYDANRNYYYCQHTVYMHETYEDHGMRYNYGPRREVIERESHQPVQVYRISNAGDARETRISGNTVSIYRPAINPASERTSHPSNAIRATQPIGKPQEISRGHENEQPAFRQEMQRQAPQTRSQNNNVNTGERGQNEFGNRPSPGTNNQQTNRPQPQHFQQENNTPGNQQSNNRPQQNTNQQMNRQQPEPNQQYRQQGNTQQMNRPQTEPNQQQYHQQGGYNQQQTNRQQPQPQQQQQMNRPQPQQQQMNRPQPQQQRPQPSQQSAPREESNRR